MIHVIKCSPNGPIQDLDAHVISNVSLSRVVTRFETHFFNINSVNNMEGKVILRQLKSHNLTAKVIIKKDYNSLINFYNL